MGDDVNDPIQSLPSEKSDQALAFRNGLTSEATGGTMHDAVYRLLRSEFMTDPETAKLLPKFVKTCSDTGDFWQFIKYQFGTYRERRDYLRFEFQPLCDFLDQTAAPSTAYISDALEKFDEEGVNLAWNKALRRGADDPEGAITAARTLLQTVCKHILDDGVEPGSKYGVGDDLPKLYAKVAKFLNIAPSQHTEAIFKQILGGCSDIVEGLGALRNRVGDAHGQGRLAVKVQARHAAQAVNLSGTMATFLVETHANRNAAQS